MELGILRLSYQELASYTDNFCENNYISHFQFGKFYRGKIDHAEWTRYVLVKTWGIPEKYIYRLGDNERRLLDEVALLQHRAAINHPGMIKLCGICIEGDRVGAVYDFKPFESVYNLIPKDDFRWLQRIKVALDLARLLKFLGTRRDSYKPYIVRNLDCAHILLDEDYNPKLCDFGLITGGIFPDRTIYRCHHVAGCYGYIDVSAISKEYDEAYEDADSDVKIPKFSIVHESLATDPDFVKADEHKISTLAIECTNGWTMVRPTIKQVLRRLLKLKVVKQHAEFLGVKKL